ncbi:hypothetical protein B0A48_00127 [Cryoendolithus antarcticus]|uniref:Large ribosomal subunit protein uL15/eL18 domain-containing protein n=1 Tax=Cryoendolithus antarcticus TaxID=1507870 RepID=A0A1V8TTM3_9PEZI|nr:hypothetical protein B0A48_00127 [Cryoendolithus antarcticus]
MPTIFRLDGSMPPRLQLLSRAARVAPVPPYQPIAPFLYPALHQQQRAASILSSLSDVKAAYGHRIRRGRGPSSGKGKTSGRGMNGQKQHGKVPWGMNGGQTKDEVINPEKGFVNNFSVEMSPVNLDRIQYWINQGRLDPSKPITLRHLHDSRCIHGIKDGIKLLARGKHELKTPINIVVSRASADAIAAIEKLGGTVTTRFYTKPSIGRILRGETDDMHSLQSRIQMAPAGMEGAEAVAQTISEDRTKYRYRLPDPTSRKDLEYYRDEAHRGYLSHLVEAGHGPSLFFNTPGIVPPGRRRASAKGKGVAAKGENRIW